MAWVGPGVAGNPQMVEILKKNVLGVQNELSRDKMGPKSCDTHGEATTKPQGSHSAPAFGPRTAPGRGKGRG